MGRVDFILNRIEGAESTASYIHKWHLHQPGEPIDAQISDPDPHGKGPYPVNFDGLHGRSMSAVYGQTLRASGHPHGTPLVLEMEIGRTVFDLLYERDYTHLQHIGRVVRNLGGVDQVYGPGWLARDIDVEPKDSRTDDLAVYTLIGCPDRLAVTCYGGWSHRWATERQPMLERAKRLADAITYKPVRVCGWLSWYVHGQGVVDLGIWEMICQSAKSVGDHMDLDWMIWADGGPDRQPYAEVAEYVEIAREVLNG